VTVSWPDVERMICRIPHVTKAHVVRDASDQVRELHIVATTGKPAKQLVRDVQSVAMAGFGVDVDRNVVSVVQLDDGRLASDPGTDPDGERTAVPVSPPARTLLTGMTLESQSGLCSVSVTLRWGEREATGSTGRRGSSRGLHRLAAESTLDAVHRLHPGVLRGDVEAADVLQLGAARVAMVTVAHQGATGEEVLVGTATVRAGGEFDALARAVLDAVNRRLPDAASSTSA
jgi:hypothetical protein